MAAESAELARVLASPVIGRAAKSQALLAVLDAAGIKGLTRSFIGTVAANGRARELVAMATAFLTELASRRGQTTVAVTSAVPLSPCEPPVHERCRALPEGSLVIDTRVARPSPPLHRWRILAA